MTFEELRQNVGAKDLSFAGKVQKAFPAEQKDGNYGPYYTQNLLMLDSADEKAYVRLQLKSEAEQVTQAGQVLAVKVSPTQGKDGKVYFNGKLGVTAPKPQPKPQAQMTYPSGQAPKTNGFGESEEQKLRSIALSYALKLVEAGILTYVPDGVFNEADRMLAYIKGHRQVKPEPKPEHDQYVMDNPPDDDTVPF